jgi:hypothetical protein
MQLNHSVPIYLKFILLTKEISFIPDNILNCCEIISIARPTKSQYSKCLGTTLPAKFKLENITNIKLLHSFNEDLMLQHKIICNKIIHNIVHVETIKFLKFRDILYDVFIYNLDVSECVWYILSTLVEQKNIKDADISEILIKTYCFFQYFNNNYRPIYHFEYYLLSLASYIHQFPPHVM